MQSSPAASIVLAALLLGACIALPADDTEGEPALFVDDWEELGDGIWPGQHWYANRLQDWRVRDGRLECVSESKRHAGRTAHLLTREIVAKGAEPVELDVVITPVDEGPLPAEACAGFLIGMGAEDIDPRATALVQQAPGEGGGLLVAIDGDGRLALRRFDQPLESSGIWVLPGGVDFQSLPALAVSEATLPPDDAPWLLSLRWRPARLSVVATGRSGTAVELELPDCPRARIAGSLSLFSARGAEGSQHGFAFDDIRLAGALPRPERSFGPIVGVLYSLAREEESATLRLSAQLTPLGDSRRSVHARLLLAEPEGTWRLAATTRVRDDDSWILPFTVRNLDPAAGARFRVEVDLALPSSWSRFTHEGWIRPEPAADETFVLGSLSCIKNQTGPIAWSPRGLWFPHAELVDAVTAQDPDMLYFGGDQIYEGDLTGPDRRSAEATALDYHTKWQRFLWTFGDLLRTRPSITVPDDHDVFHGNLWGAGGIRGEARDGLSAQDAGGYRQSPEFVRMVHATQTSHLPPSLVTPRIGAGITTYTTRLFWGGVDFAVLSDRMWKDSPGVAAPAGGYVNGWPQAEGYEPARARAEVARAQLLGEEQEAFLADWGRDRSSAAWTKVVLSQSPFACLHTLPRSTKSDAVVGRLQPPKPGEVPPDDLPVTDGDSNGWPQPARDRAVRLLRDAGALHLAGDQHLGSTALYGLDRYGDGTVVFTSPAIANAWPRRWMPARAGGGRAPNALPFTGEFRDGFGNRVTMLAVANPVDDGREPFLLYSRSPGYGIVRFHPDSKSVTLEAWPRWADHTNGTPFAGWPIRLDAHGRPLASSPEASGSESGG